MRVLVQRVSSASVVVSEETVGAIERGLLLLVGIHGSDTEAELAWMAHKCAGLRIFADNEDKMNLSVKEVDGELLVVSQFTLYGNSKKGFRPSFIEAAPPEHANAMYERFTELLSQETKKPVQRGRFAASMKVHLVNDGPVTIFIERNSSD